jgi:peptidoglycan-N-acetylmuramic acid deacetylase
MILDEITLYNTGARKILMAQNESRRQFLKKQVLLTGSLLLSTYLTSKSILTDPLYNNTSFGAGEPLQNNSQRIDEIKPQDLAIDISSRKRQFIIDHPIRDGDMSRKVALLTYDDWGNDEQLTSILDAFSRFPKSNATFFFCGAYLSNCTRSIERMVNEGHVIGCHSWEHVWMDTLTTSEINQSFGKFIKTLRQIIPGYQPEYFRMPYGGCKDPKKYYEVIEIAADWGLQHVYWSFYTEGKTPDGREIIKKNLAKGSIILCHMNYYFDILNTSWMLDYLEYRGYSAETLKTGLSPENYWNQ